MILVRRRFLCWGLALFIGSYGGEFVVAQDPKDPSDNASLIRRGSYTQNIKFLVNRGPRAVSFLKEVLHLLSADHIKKMPAFDGMSQTRITLMSYEFRSREVLFALSELLKLGASVRVVVDPATIESVPLYTTADLNKLSESQQAYYITQYDLDRDGIVSAEDIRRVNSERDLSRRLWEQLQILSQQYERRVELIVPRFEPVPHLDGQSYPHMTHFKKYQVEFRRGKEWIAHEAIVSSANLTDSCLDRRISMSKINVDRYVSGAPYNYAKGTEGNIQFGARLVGVDLLQTLQGPSEQWIELFKRGKHFDDLPPSDALPPRVVFKGRHLSYLEAFYSGGLKNKKTFVHDPLSSVLRRLLLPENKLKVYWDSQFVFTDHASAKLLRKKIVDSPLESLKIFVDGNFASESFSALPTLLFAPTLNTQHGVLSTKSIVDLPAIPSSTWSDNVFEFRGELGVFGARGDKLHSKVSYFEYETATGERRSLVVWGSANKSSKASAWNADSLWVLDTTDPSVRDFMVGYFSALEQEPRIRSYGLAWLERRLLEGFNPNPEFFSEKISKWAARLNSGLTKYQTKILFKDLLEVGPLNLHGKQILKLLNFVERHQSRKFTWSDFALIVQLAMNPSAESAVVSDVLSYFALENSDIAHDELRGVLRKAARRRPQITRVDDPILQEILKDCESYLRRIQPQ